MPSQRISRRRFIAHAGLASAAILGRSPAAAYPANERLGVALAGVSGRGSWFVRSVPGTGCEVVALCDVDDRRAAEAFAKFPEAGKYRDFRRMLDKERSVDGVIVATPDNTHAVISMGALEAGKHVYCEKPLAHDVFEVRALTRAARRLGLATQMGNQGTASRGYRRALAAVKAGLLGEVREVHAWKDGAGSGERPVPEGTEPVPDHFDWDLWLGPARERPFHPRWLKWHGWRDFGTGALGNWACHVLNLPFRALELDALWRKEDAAKGEETAAGAGPAGDTIRIAADCSGHPVEGFPRRAWIHWDFPARKGHPPVRMTWYGGLGRDREKRAEVESLLGRPLDFGDHGRKKWEDHAGVLLIGSKGKMHLNAHNTTFTLLPEGDFEDVEEPEHLVLRSPGHTREWVRACRGGEAAMSHFGYAGPLTETVLLGHVATRFPRALDFDPQAMECRDDPEADGALRREYRDGWSLGTS